MCTGSLVKSATDIVKLIEVRKALLMVLLTPAAMLFLMCSMTIAFIELNLILIEYENKLNGGLVMP